MFRLSDIRIEPGFLILFVEDNRHAVMAVENSAMEANLLVAWSVVSTISVILWQSRSTTQEFSHGLAPCWTVV